MLTSGKMNHLCIFICIILIGFDNFVTCKIPDYIKPCQKNEQLSDCLLENANEVINYLSVNNETKLKISSIDKFHAEKLAMHATKDLQVLMTDINFLGIEKTEVKEISLVDNTLHMKLYMPQLQFIGNYNFNGRLLVLSLHSEGFMNITQVGITFDYLANMKIEDRKGRKYYYASNDPQQTSLKLLSMENNIFYFDNLFPGELRISQEMNVFLNDNWRDVYTEVQDVMLEQITAILINPVVNGYLRHIPIDNLFAK